MLANEGLGQNFGPRWGGLDNILNKGGDNVMEREGDRPTISPEGGKLNLEFGQVPILFSSLPAWG